MPETLVEPRVDNILTSARARGCEAGLPYAGAVTPPQAWELVQAGSAHIIDVRNRYEWEFVGRVPDTTMIEWKHYPSGELNGRFIDEIKSRFSADDNLLFLCRSGVRSDAAAKALNAAGFKNAFNILEGFEGDLDADGHRGQIGGWRKHGLPWKQG
jgi:rhodanese-related sulfurtransferase